MIRAALLAIVGGCAADETISGYLDTGTTWQLTEMNGATFKATATIQFPEEGSVTGKSPCNRYTAAQAAPYPWIDIGPIAATKLACPALEAEGTFFAALEAMTIAEVSGPVLIMNGENGEEMIFAALPSE
ncbi:MAG: META domain-containing protein [Rhodobacteraceae bacterium]|nr:META domain-containing protein [Paracoccaceae bacterium]